MRALIDMDEKQIRELDRLAKTQKRSRASVVREAVSDYLRRRSADTDKDAFGLWGERKIDGLAYQDKIRGEW
jgi:predicted transcriptional regulator